MDNGNERPDSGSSVGIGPEEGPRRILIVEDDISTREALKDALVDEGFSVVEAENGERALDQMKALAPHLVLTDLMMPGMSGMELIREMSSRRGLCDLPIVIMTAARNMSAVPPGHPVFLKPLRVEALVRTLSGFLS